MGAAAMTGAAEYDVLGGGFFARGANWSAARALLDACGGGDFFGAGAGASGVGAGAGAAAGVEGPASTLAAASDSAASALALSLVKLMPAKSDMDGV
jgi:hypothetical protein